MTRQKFEKIKETLKIWLTATLKSRTSGCCPQIKTPSQTINYIETFVQNSSSLSTIGLGAIIFTSVMFFADYEYVINRIMNTTSRKYKI